MRFQIDEYTARAIKKFPQKAQDIVQSFDKKQVKCKEWLYNELLNLPINPERIYVAGSWYGNVLVPYLLNLYPDVDTELVRAEALEQSQGNYEIKVFFKDKEEEAKQQQAQYTITRLNQSMAKDTP